MTVSRAPVMVLNWDAAVSLCPLPFHAGGVTSQSSLGPRPPALTLFLLPSRQVVAVHVYAVCGRVRRPPAAHFDPVQ